MLIGIIGLFIYQKLSNQKSKVINKALMATIATKAVAEANAQLTLVRDEYSKVNLTYQNAYKASISSSSTKRMI